MTKRADFTASNYRNSSGFHLRPPPSLFYILLHPHAACREIRQNHICKQITTVHASTIVVRRISQPFLRKEVDRFDFPLVDAFTGRLVTAATHAPPLHTLARTRVAKRRFVFAHTQIVLSKQLSLRPRDFWQRKRQKLSDFHSLIHRRAALSALHPPLFAQAQVRRHAKSRQA